MNYCHECGKETMKHSVKTYTKHYKNQVLHIHNLPIQECECGEILYGASDLLNGIRQAKKHFEETGGLVTEFTDQQAL